MFFLFFLTSHSSSFSSLTLLCIFFLPIHRTSSSSSSSCSNPIIFIVLFLKPYHPSLMESSGYSHNTGSGLNRHCVHCECNLYAPLATAWTDNNAGVRFFGCGNYKVCDWFCVVLVVEIYLLTIFCLGFCRTYGGRCAISLNGMIHH